jgi:hypothetical protein
VDPLEGGQSMSVNPYVGPRALRKGELLFGRDREVRELVAMLISDRIVLLYSPSGAGKTSLIQARLVQALEEEELRVLPLLRVSAEPLPEDREAARPANRYVLGTLLSLDPGRSVPIAELAGLRLDAFLRRLDTEEGDDRPQVLIFDQFEEILTLDPADQEAREAFFAQVGEALRDRRRWALFAMREDYVGALEPYVARLPSRLRTMFRLDLLSPGAACQAICEPARAQGVDFEKAAADLLVDDLRTMLVQRPDGTSEKRPGPYVEPVHLQVVCHRLWERRPAGTAAINASQIDPTGGDVDAALAAYYADWVRTIAKGDRSHERAIRDWFEESLITEHGTRGQVLLTPGTSQGLANELIQALVKEAHLLRAEARRGSTWFELSHDRLIAPVKSNNAEWRSQNLTELERRALAWGQGGLYPESLLLREKNLLEAEEQAKTQELTELEKELLEASRKARDEAEKERASRRTAAELDWQRHQNRRFRWFVAVAFTLAAIAVGGWYKAWQETSRAQQETDRALNAEADAKKVSDTLKEQNEKLRQANSFALERQTKDYFEKRSPASTEAGQHALQDPQDPPSEPPFLTGRQAVPVDFFYAPPSRESEEAIRQLREKQFEVSPQGNGRYKRVNAIWYGEGVDVESVRLVALTLIEAGMVIQQIAYINKPGKIQVGTSEKSIYTDPLTVDQILTLQLKKPLHRRRVSLPQSPPP